MKAVIHEYLEDHPGSFSSIKKSLSENPQAWKRAEKGDTTGDKPF
jgi:hypothetical protein